MELILVIIAILLFFGLLGFIVENFDTILIVVGVIIAVAVVTFIIYVIKEEHKAKQDKKIEEHKAKQNKKIEKHKETENKKKEIEEKKEKLIVAKFVAPPKAYKVPYLSNNIKGEQKRVNEAYVKFLNRKNEIDKAAAKVNFYLDLNRSYKYLIEENVEVADYLSYEKECEDAFKKCEALLKDFAPLNKLPIQSSAYDSLAQSFHTLNIVDDKNDVPTELIEFFSNFSNDVYFNKHQNYVYIFNPLYIWKYDCDKMTFTIIDYSDFYASVCEETKTIDEDTYIKDGYSYDDIKEMHYTYENIDGTPDRRRNYNPAYYDVYDCSVHVGQQGFNHDRFYDFIKVGSKDETEDTVKEINKFFAKKDNIGTIQLKNAILTCKDGNFEERLNELKRERKNELDEKKRIEQEKKAEEEKEKQEEKKRIEEEKKAEKERIEKEKQEEKKRVEEEKKAEKERIEKEKEGQRRIAEEKENELKEDDRQKWLLNEWSKVITAEKERNLDEKEIKEREQKEEQRKAEEDAKKRQAQLEFEQSLDIGALVQVNGQKVITNNIFSLELTQKEDTPNTEKYKLYFVDKLGNIISNEKTVDKMAIGESKKVTFELFSKLTFSALKPYYLLVSDDSNGKLINKTKYKIDIAFSNDFGF